MPSIDNKKEQEDKPSRGIIKPAAESKGEIIIYQTDNGKNKIDVKGWKLISPQSFESSIMSQDGVKYLKIDKETPLIVDLGKTFQFSSFSYTPVPKEKSSNILKYNFYISADGRNWKKLKDNAMFNNIANSPVAQYVQLSEIVESRYAVTRRNRTIHTRIREYVYELTHTKDFVTSIVPIGDGITLSVKQ